MSRKYDVIVYGANGFTGRLVCEYLLTQRQLYNPPLSIAFSARNLGNLQKLQQDLNCKDVDIIAVSGSDIKSLDDMICSTRTLIQTAGPFSLFGEPFLKSCCKNGTHYCDLTGETAWVRNMQEVYQDLAIQNRVKVVQFAGFDSVPSDLSTLFWSSQLFERYGEKVLSVRNYYEVEGDISGGTLNSMIAFGSMNSSDRNKAMDPYVLCNIPSDQKVDDDHPVLYPKWDSIIGKYVGPWIMEGCNSRVVRKTRSLLGSSSPFDARMTYFECLCSKSWFAMVKMTVLVLILLLLLLIPGGNWILHQVGPASGEGPNAERRKKSWFKVTTVALSANYELRGLVSGGDPGYGDTAKIISEIGIGLARDSLQPVYGFLTPSLAFGVSLVERLKKFLKWTLIEMKPLK